MMTRIHGQVHFECDGCGDVFDGAHADFNTALQAAKDDGWRAQQFAGVWCHYCESCNAEKGRRL